MYDAGPLMSPEEFHKTEHLLAEYVRRKQAGIPLTKRIPPHTETVLKSFQNSTIRRHVEFAQITEQLAGMKREADRRQAARTERERKVLAKAIATTQALIKANPDRKGLAYIASIQRRLDEVAARFGVTK